MPGSRSHQDHDIHAHVEQTPAAQAESVQDGTANLDRMAQLFVKVPQLSVLANAFFAITPILAVADTMGGRKHG